MNAVDTLEVRARVIAVVPEYHQAIAESLDGQWQLAITRHTEGVSLDEVREGQVYLLTVKGLRLPRVVRAKLIDPGTTSHVPSQKLEPEGGGR